MQVVYYKVKSISRMDRNLQNFNMMGIQIMY